MNQNLYIFMLTLCKNGQKCLEMSIFFKICHYNANHCHVSELQIYDVFIIRSLVTKGKIGPSRLGLWNISSISAEGKDSLNKCPGYDTK